jgi:hypothetical protein
MLSPTKEIAKALVNLKQKKGDPLFKHKTITNTNLSS